MSKKRPGGRLRFLIQPTELKEIFPQEVNLKVGVFHSLFSVFSSVQLGPKNRGAFNDTDFIVTLIKFIFY